MRNWIGDNVNWWNSTAVVNSAYGGGAIGWEDTQIKTFATVRGVELIFWRWGCGVYVLAHWSTKKVLVFPFLELEDL